MYDYFTTQVHLDAATAEAAEFFERFLSAKSLDLQGKSVIDISGGNGNFLRWYCERFRMLGSFTEINQRALDYAREAQPFEQVVRYDLNSDQLLERTNRRFDVVMARACVMFANDVGAFAKQCFAVTEPGGVVILDRSTEPTIGTFVRVQLDEFSYHALRQPGTVQAAFLEAGFELEARHDETDPSLYVYDHDLLPHWKVLHYYYEIKALSELGTERVFNLC